MLLLMLSLIYALLFYFMLTDQIKLDFYSFYSASAALLHGDNPYQLLFASYLPAVKKLSTNLNPPILLMLFMPLSRVSHHTGLIIWSISSFILGTISATAAFKLAFSPEFFKNHWLSLYIVYLALFSTLMNTHIAQLGAFTAFFLIVGYYLYQHKHETLAAIFWGIIISIKIFPALLFIYVLRQAPYKMLGIMFATVVLMWLIPLLAFGMDIYSNYFNMLTRVLWYGDSWNASIYGFLFRLLVDTHQPDNLRLVHILYVILCCGLVVWYLKKIVSTRIPDDKNHQQFCLTLTVMLLISPLGWMYYFPLILLPLLITWSQAIQSQEKKSMVFLWLICLFLINFPIDYIESKNMPTLFEKLTICSFYFYGLLLLTWLVARKNQSLPASATSDYLIRPIGIVLAFGVVVLCISNLLVCLL